MDASRELVVEGLQEAEAVGSQEIAARGSREAEAPASGAWAMVNR